VVSEIKMKSAKKAVRKPKSIPAQLLKAAIQAFGDENVAKEWWWSTHEFTLQMCPSKLAQTPKGRRFLKDYLDAVIDLNYGSFS
jgi:uncharacterized protein (DUF2384 family)